MRVLSCVIFIYALISCQSESLSPSSKSTQDKPLFEKIEASESGLHFTNSLQEDLSNKFNLLDFDYFYNGAGVGIADLNNDGLEDVVMTANMVDNKLFLNQGNLKFKDVTSASGINYHKHWSNGVTFADVNGDGWLDIYISQGGPHIQQNRKNLLYINNKDLSFSESAESYGLADDGISTQSSFFDYDLDGDLDCIVMNESVLYGYDPLSFLQRIATNKADNKQSISRLYENVDGHYIDVSLNSGISKPTYGLGLSVADINDDGYPDIYIANDYYLPDVMYINQGDGSFKDEIKQRTSQVSMFGMGVDIDDINQDGKQDIFVLDMAAADHIRSKTLMASMDTRQFSLLVDRLRFQYQYMYNALQVNDGSNKFKNLSQMSGIAKTDWSWAGLIADYDLDGKKDIFVTNGYRRYGLDNDFKQRVRDAKLHYQNQVPLNIKEELYFSMPEGKLPNALYKNEGDLHFSDMASEWGMQDSTFSNGAAIADLDLDGDLDIVINNIDQEMSLYRNLAADRGTGHYLKVSVEGDLSESMAKVYLYQSGRQMQIAEIKRVRGYRSAVSPIAHFGMESDDLIDSLIVSWPGDRITKKYDLTVDQTINISTSETEDIEFGSMEISQYFSTIPNGQYGLNYIHRENVYDDFAEEVLLPMRQSTLGPKLAQGDLNGDGAEDLIVGGAAGYATACYFQEDNIFKRRLMPALEADANYEDMGILVLDIDNDGDQDLFITSGGNAFPISSQNYTNRLYLNDGSGSFQRSAQPALAETLASSAMAASADLDGDGTAEIIVANRIKARQYPAHAASVIYRYIDGQLKDVTSQVAPDLEDFGIINELIVTDFDVDGDADLIAVGEWTSIGLFRNDNGILANVSAQLGLDDFSGWWYSIAETDADGDDFPDYVIGNLGLNSKYKASKDKPLRVYANDFDDNGTHDIVLSTKYKDEYVPLRGKECSSQQMPFLKSKYPSYEQFANASLIDIYGSKLSSSLHREATIFESVLLRQSAAGFEVIPLPRPAQEFPIMDILTMDVNQDGYEDLIVAGNIYQTEVETPRLDSGQGCVLLGDGRGAYQVMDMSVSGLSAGGDVKSMVTIRLRNGKNLLVVGKNQALIQIIEYTK